MIETQFYILDAEQFAQFSAEAAIEGVSVDYYLAEFCDIEGEWVLTD